MNVESSGGTAPILLLLLPLLMLVAAPAVAQTSTSTPSSADIQFLGRDCDVYSITDTHGDGALISADDGNTYLIDDSDQYDTSSWSDGDNLLVCYAEYKYNGRMVGLYTLRDLDNDPSDEIDVTLIH